MSAKSDPGDAYILADVLRTDGHRLRPLQPQSDAIKALRALVRGRDDLIAARVALANRHSLIGTPQSALANRHCNRHSPIGNRQ